MEFPKAYISYLVHFHSERDYFECHEVLEEYWKEHGMGRNSIWVGLIQVAVTYYHYRRGNFIGAQKMIQKALQNIRLNKEKTELLGIDYECLIQILCDSKIKMINRIAYIPVNLPIMNASLLLQCQQYCKLRGLSWGSNFENAPQSIINKHIYKRAQSLANSL